MPRSFLPIKRMMERIESTKNDSDLAYFFDLLLLGEQLTKTITLFLVAAINEDKERTKYRHEHFLVRANAIGDFSKTIDEILTGPASELLTVELRSYEFKELNQRTTFGTWQFDSLTLLNDCLNTFKIPHDGLGLKAPLRLWFQLFTVLRNKTKGHGATKFEPCADVCPKLFDSINLIIDNFSMFNRPWAYFYRNISGKYRISYLTENATEFDYLKRETNHSFENGIYTLIDSPRKINLLFSNPELIDFYFPNGNLKKEVFETISYVSDERVEQSARAYLNPVTPLPGSDTEGQMHLDVLGNSFTNLPVQVENYIKRNLLEKELKNVLLDKERFPIVTLVGRGGIGKTSLSINVIREIAFSNRFDLIIWFSARDIDLLQDGPKQVKTKVLNQKDIAENYCSLVYPNKKIKEKVDFFSEELTKNSIGNTLFIFDNFETITNPVEVYEWINTHIRNPNKVLITSRISRNFKADYPIEVKGMSDNECRELITVFSENFQIQHLISDKFIEDLIIESDGHPYIIKILLGEVAKNKKLGKIQRIVAEKDKVLSALFKRTFNTLSPAAKRVFLTLCSWNSSIPQIAVEAVLWRPENEKIEVEEAIEELRKSSFLEVLNDGVDSFINVPLAASIYGKSELEVYPEKLMILEDRKLLMEFGAVNQRNISSGLAPRIDKKFSAVAQRIKSITDFKKELPTLEYIASKYPKSWILISAIYEEYGDYEGVKYSLREFLKTSKNNTEKAKYWLKLAEICRFTKDLEGESHAISEMVIIPGIPFEMISDCANRINSIFYNNPELRQAEYKKVLLQKIIDIMIQRIDEANATDYSRLAWILLNNNESERAKEFVEKGLEIDNFNTHCIRLYHKINSR